ncbi:MAG: OmpA family protein, partial [bacterium]
LDSDKDGVVDSLDKCPETPEGAKVDEAGCELDSDKDGVSDAADLCPDTESGVEVDMTGCNKAAPIALEGVKFKTGSADLTEESLGILDKLVEGLKSLTGIKLEVSGHTDDRGDAELNRNLSQQRAESVRSYLIESGVPAESLQAKGYGEEKPVADNATPEGRAQNRRVELKRLDQ